MDCKLSDLPERFLQAEAIAQFALECLAEIRKDF